MEAGGSAPGGIVVVTEGGPQNWAIVNAVRDRLGPVTVIQEDPEPKSALLKRRIRKQGWVSAAGQFATMVLVRLGKRLHQKRAAEIARQYGLATAPRAGQAIIHVASVNSPQFRQAVADLRPQVVFLTGCRLLTRETLAAIACPVLNYHPGITPKYRGMNSGYWALATGDRENFGSTVHLVDSGVDTGAILYRAHLSPEKGDNIALYALRIAALSGDICVNGIEDALSGRLKPVEATLPSRLWFHPPLWSYLWTGFTRGVW